ncbi:hypothetical protein VE03_04828 [Pseudogymnoascus sp. 23342-1-I1]|nr:hypothetical protein VE03_04828 [Pseudogymnoascus sp. 23342-1-I1]
MAWDSESARRRQSNIISPQRVESPAQPLSTETYTPKSTHVADPTLNPFLAPSFNAADYLNATLPPLKARTSTQRVSKEVPLAELSTQTQTLLSQLSAHTTRLTNTLTQLTDEIIRSGSRLAYEVEVLRGETLGLSESLTEGLHEDISKFVPGGIDSHPGRKSSGAGGTARRKSSTSLDAKAPTDTAQAAANGDPAYIQQLRTLTLVRGRLDTVIKTFGDAMSWTFPPSEVSVSSGFLSVSAAEPGSEAQSIEEKGQQVSKKLRDEIADILIRSDDPVDCIEAAAKRVEELKELSTVWKGTAEEKARVRFVESLAKMVEDRHRSLLREQQEQEKGAKNKTEVKATGAVPTASATDSKSQSSYGFISQLQKMRGGI